MRPAILCIVAISVACGRSGVELVDVGGERGEDGASDDGDGASGRGGTTPTGGANVGGTSTGGSPPTGGIGGRAAGGRGGTPTGGMAGSGGLPEPPIDPGGPIPNCATSSPVFVEPKENHWLYLEAGQPAEMLAGRFLVELTPNGPRNVTYLAETGGVRGWSHDGRFLAFTTTDPYPPEILDFSGGMPVPVAVTPRTGAIFQWSNSDSRYAFVPYKTVTDVTSVVVVDAATGIEQVVDVLANGLELATWSWNDHHVALAGDRLWLIDTSGAELAALQIYDRDADDPQWSPNSRYLAFAAHLPPPDEGTRRLYVYDTIAGTLDLVNEDRWNVGLEFTWAGDSELIMGLEDEAFFLDLDAGSLTWLPFVTYGEDGGFGSVSPGGRCYVYDGYCEAAGEDGICIKTLPPDPQKPSVLIHRYDHESWTKRWSGNGDQLLLASGAAPWLINVETNGGEFGLGELRRRLVTIGTNTSSVRSVIGWNPNGRSDWITYSATPSRAGDVSAHPRLWNSENGRSFDVDVGSALQGWAWSRDGRYLVIKSGPTTADGMYHVQSVLDGELGDLWEVDLISPGGSNLWPIYLQP